MKSALATASSSAPHLRRLPRMATSRRPQRSRVSAWRHSRYPTGGSPSRKRSVRGRSRRRLLLARPSPGSPQRRTSVTCRRSVVWRSPAAVHAAIVTDRAGRVATLDDHDDRRPGLSAGLPHCGSGRPCHQCGHSRCGHRPSKGKGRPRLELEGDGIRCSHEYFDPWLEIPGQLSRMPTRDSRSARSAISARSQVVKSSRRAMAASTSRRKMIGLSASSSQQRWP
jgi:hypothetical protein